MTRRQLVAGNWKMHGSREMLASFLQAFSQNTSLAADAALFVPFTLLGHQSNTDALHIGAQNVSEHEKGAFTGEIAAAMLKDAGCAMSLVGHSERRHIYGETSDVVAQKCLRLWAKGLTPVLCVGETEAEREAGETESVVREQLLAVYELMPDNEVTNIIIAYEPVWAIGSGKAATDDEAQAVHAFIRAWLTERVSAEVAFAQTILYGGSVKSHNAPSLFAKPDIDGALVGGASLDCDEFLRIISCIKPS